MLALGLPAAPVAQDGGRSLDDVVKSIKERGNVRVLAAESVTVDGKPMYRIKVLTNGGRVKYIWIDPEG